MSFLADLRQEVFSREATSIARGRRLARAAWRWWVDELAALVPAGLTRAILGRGSVLTLNWDHDMLALGQARFPPSGPVPASLRHRLARADAVDLVLPAHLVLRRVIDIPQAAARELESAIPFLAERHTPFRAGQARTAWRVRGRAPARQVTLELAATAAPPLAQMLAALHAQGITISAILVAGDDRLPRLDFAAGQEAHRARLLGAPWRALLAASLAVALLGPVCVAAIVHLRVQAAVYGPAAPAGDAPQRAGALRENLAAATFLAPRANAPEPLLLLQHITRALPDSAWLFSFDLAGEDLILGGFSTDLPAMVAHLQALPEVRHLAFRAPVIHDRGTGGDRFDIVLHLQPGAR